MGFCERLVKGTATVLTAVVSPIIIVAEHLQNLVLGYIPSYVQEVVIVSPNNNIGQPPSVRRIYTASEYYFSWHRAFPVTAFITGEDDFYLFRVWNSQLCKESSYFLNAKHLTRALGLTSVRSLWALSDLGIVNSLEIYMQSVKNKRLGIFDIRIGAGTGSGTSGSSATASQRHAPIMASLDLPENITARGLCALDAFMFPSHQEKSDAPRYTVTVTNYELEENDCADDAFLTTAS